MKNYLPLLCASALLWAAPAWSQESQGQCPFHAAKAAKAGEAASKAKAAETAPKAEAKTAPAHQQTQTAAKPAQAAKPAPLAASGDKNPLPGGGWFTWEFDKKPQLGTLIVKIRAYGKDGKQQSPFKITGESGMPSMRAHDSGPAPFQLNRKGDYLLPVDVVMPGQWRITVRVSKDGSEISAGEIDFAL